VQHLPLVRAIALSVYAKLAGSVELEQLIQSGISGLCDATVELNGLNEDRFASYLKYRIREAILGDVLHGASYPRLPRAAVIAICGWQTVPSMTSKKGRV
jgi:RNA polymerase sigma factor for flagellar operon FliA